MKTITKLRRQLGQITGEGLPPPLGFDHDGDWFITTEGSPKQWNKGVTREEAEAINQSKINLVRLLNNPVPSRMPPDYRIDGENTG